ncbi:MAG: ferric enterobactin receptor [Arcticibacterium sp.]|jgi:ferric enterobactin receptor
MFLAFCLLSFSSYAQNRTLKIQSAHYSDMTISTVLSTVQREYGFKIEFDQDLIPTTKINIRVENLDLDGFLSLLIEQYDLDFALVFKNPNAVKIVSKTEFISEQAANKKSNFQPERKNFTLSGVVKDEFSGETLPFATLSILGHSNIASQTNVDGYYSLLYVPSDTALIQVSYVGYLRKVIRLTPGSDTENFMIELKENSQNLDEVVVTADKTEMVQANQVVGMIKMTPKNIAKLPNVGEKDPFRAFQLMPGVSASNESSSGLYVRGGTPDQTLVLYDGFTVYNVDHLFGFFSAFNYNAIKDIQLYKGGFDARFGGRISAVAEITGKEGNSKEFNAGVDLSLLSASAFVETPIGNKLTFLAAARRSYKGALYKKIFEQFTTEEEETQPVGGRPGGGRFGGNNLQTTETASTYFYDLNAKLTYKPTTKDIFSLSFFNGTDNMDNSAESSFSGFGGIQDLGIDLGSSTNDLSQWGNTGASLKWSRQWNSKLYSNTLLSFSNFYSERDNSRNISIVRGDSTFKNKQGRFETNNLSDYSFKTDWEWKVDGNHQLEFGGMLTQNSIQFNYTQNDTTTILDRDDSGMLSSVYFQDRIKAFDGKLEVIPGLRVNHFDVTNKIYAEPRLTFNYMLTDKFKIKGGGGIYNQFIKQINREDISQGNRNFWILANGESLPVTQSKHLIIGAAYEMKDYLLDVEFYQKKNTGVTEYSLRFVPDVAAGGPPGRGNGGGLSVDETFFNGNETIRGVDVLLQKKFGKYTGWLGYTFSEAVRQVDAFSDKPYYSDQDVRHQFKAVGSYSINNWDLAATWIYSTGRPYTSIIGAYDLTLLDGTSKTFTNPSDKNANRFNPYHRMDVSATYNFRNGSIGLSVFNLYDKTNIWYKRFEIIEEAEVSILQTTDVTYLGFTPNLSLSFRLK